MNIVGDDRKKNVIILRQARLSLIEQYVNSKLVSEAEAIEALFPTGNKSIREKMQQRYMVNTMNWWIDW